MKPSSPWCMRPSVRISEPQLATNMVVRFWMTSSQIWCNIGTVYQRQLSISRLGWRVVCKELWYNKDRNPGNTKNQTAKEKQMKVIQSINTMKTSANDEDVMKALAHYLDFTSQTPTFYTATNMLFDIWLCNEALGDEEDGKMTNAAFSHHLGGALEYVSHVAPMFKLEREVCYKVAQCFKSPLKWYKWMLKNLPGCTHTLNVLNYKSPPVTTKNVNSVIKTVQQELGRNRMNLPAPRDRMMSYCCNIIVG